MASDYLFSCQEEIDKNMGALATILVGQKICSGKDAIVVRDAYEHFGLLSSAFDKRFNFHYC